MGGHHHDPAALPPLKGPGAYFREGEWTPGPVWTCAEIQEILGGVLSETFPKLLLLGMGLLKKIGIVFEYLSTVYFTYSVKFGIQVNFKGCESKSPEELAVATIPVCL